MKKVLPCLTQLALFDPGLEPETCFPQSEPHARDKPRNSTKELAHRNTSHGGLGQLGAGEPCSMIGHKPESHHVGTTIPTGLHHKHMSSTSNSHTIESTALKRSFFFSHQISLARPLNRCAAEELNMCGATHSFLSESAF